MRYASYAWTAALLGALLFIVGLVLFFVSDPLTAGGVKNFQLVNPMLIGGSFLLAVGLLALQQSYTAWCTSGGCGDGCSCCGDECSCGDGQSHDGHKHD